MQACVVCPPSDLDSACSSLQSTQTCMSILNYPKYEIYLYIANSNMWFIVAHVVQSVTHNHYILSQVKGPFLHFNLSLKQKWGTRSHVGHLIDLNRAGSS